MAQITGTANSCETVDALPKELREVVYEYGLSVVRAFLESGTKEPNKISHLIHTVHLGAREYSNLPRRQKNVPTILTLIDDILIRCGAGPVGMMLVRELYQSNAAIIPIDGTKVGQCVRELAFQNWPFLKNR